MSDASFAGPGRPRDYCLSSTCLSRNLLSCSLMAFISSSFTSHTRHCILNNPVAPLGTGRKAEEEIRKRARTISCWRSSKFLICYLMILVQNTPLERREGTIQVFQSWKLQGRPQPTASWSTRIVLTVHRLLFLLCFPWLLWSLHYSPLGKVKKPFMYTQSTYSQTPPPLLVMWTLFFSKKKLWWFLDDF